MESVKTMQKTNNPARINTMTDIILAVIIATGFITIRSNLSNQPFGADKDTPSVYVNAESGSDADHASTHQDDTIQAYIDDTGAHRDWWVSGNISNGSIKGIKPFEHISKNDIEYATVEIPPHAKVSLTDHEIDELISLLKNVIIYNQDDSFAGYIGQDVIFTLTRTDGTQDIVEAFNTFTIINGVGYLSNCWPCEQLYRLGSKIIKVD